MLAACIFLLLAVACGDDDNGIIPTASGPSSDSATPVITASPAPASPSPSGEPFNGGREPVEAPPPAGFVTALLIDVQTGEHEGFDRITFEFSGGVPGFRVEYVEPPIHADPSDLLIEIAGDAFIRIRMEPAAGYDPDTGTPTYNGPLELTPGFASLVEAERMGDFEGVLQWVLGLTEKTDFRVETLEGPPRLVIDVAHP
jgi:hypothetical protein